MKKYYVFILLLCSILNLFLSGCCCPCSCDRLSPYISEKILDLYEGKAGGKTVPELENLNYHFNTVCFLDINNGWVSGTKGVILHTSDGGSTWKLQHIMLPDEEPGVMDSYDIEDICFADENHGWALGLSSKTGKFRQIILNTTDGGNTWQEQSNGTVIVNSFNTVVPRFEGVCFQDNNNGWTVGGEPLEGKDSLVPAILYTEDGGGSWSRLEFEPEIIEEEGLLTGVYFFDKLNGWISGYHGFILNTEDGGENWYVQESNTEENLYDIYFVDKLNGWAICGDNDLLHTVDGGTTWTKQACQGEYSFQKIYFSDTDNGWIAGEKQEDTKFKGIKTGNPLILHTVDGGNTWTEQKVNLARLKYSLPLRDICFADKQNGWAAGEYGLIVHTDDGGTNWNVQIRPCW